MPDLERPRVEYLTPEDLVRDVQRGEIRVPQFQRNFIWEASDIVRLFESLLAGFPIGNLLLWRRRAPAQRIQIGPLSLNAPETASALWVVDGQQRIVSLVGALTSAETSTDPRFRVHFDLDTGKFHTAGPRQRVSPSWLPVSILLNTASLLRWMRENSDWLTEDQLDLADQAAKAIREYQIPTYVVSSEREETLLEIFVRMNDTGKRLRKTDIFQALHANFAGDVPSDLHAIAQLPAQLGFGALDDDLSLRCMLAYRGGDVFREEFREEFMSDDDREQTFAGVASALRAVVEFLQGTAEIPHIKLLPYSFVVPVLLRFVHLFGPPEGRTATLLRRWVWRHAVAGIQGRGGSVTEKREQISMLDGADPLTAAMQLLRKMPQFSDFRPELTTIHFSHASTKISTLGLWSAGPLDPVTGKLTDITRLLDSGTPLHSIVPEKITRAATIANKAIVTQRSGASLANLLAAATPEIATSHLIDDRAATALAAKDAATFLAIRERACEQAIQRQVVRMAEWGARDGRAIVDTLRRSA